MHRILVLADVNSVHTRKWVEALATRNFQIGIFSLSKNKSEYPEKHPNITVFNDVHFDEGTFRKSSFSKLRYLRVMPYLKKVARQFEPDIVHAHYASSYGLLGALLNFKPLVISVWGSDVFDFPRQSILHKFIFKKILGRASSVSSTSHIMAKELGNYTKKVIHIVPFGVDLEIFQPITETSGKQELVIGTIKALEPKYGIHHLLQTFKILSDRFVNLPLRFMIVGGGSLEKKLRQFAEKLGIEEKVCFTGAVPFEQVADYHRQMSVFVALSVNDSESFGVAAVEASACGVPVVVSRVGGLQEVVEDRKTGFVVEPNRPELAADFLEKLITNEELRKQMGRNGRGRAELLYNWEKNIAQMLEIYYSIVPKVA